MKHSIFTIPSPHPAAAEFLDLLNNGGKIISATSLNNGTVQYIVQHKEILEKEVD